MEYNIYDMYKKMRLCCDSNVKYCIKDFKGLLDGFVDTNQIQDYDIKVGLNKNLKLFIKIYILENGKQDYDLLKTEINPTWSFVHDMPLTDYIEKNLHRESFKKELIEKS